MIVFYVIKTFFIGCSSFKGLLIIWTLYNSLKPALFIVYPEAILLSTTKMQRERGQWAVYYTSTQCFIITFSYSFNQQL